MKKEATKERFLVSLGKKVREIRINKGFSQVKLANILGKDQQSIQRLEAGKINPSIFYLSEIAKGLEIELFELLKP